MHKGRTLAAVLALTVLAVGLVRLLREPASSRNPVPSADAGPYGSAPDASAPLPPGDGMGVRAGDGQPGLTKHYARSSALLIGIGAAYARSGFTALPNAEPDVQLLLDALLGLRGENWTVLPLVGEKATKDAILRELAELYSRAAENDKVVVTFAGHGFRHEVSSKSGWIVPADGQPEALDPAHASWVRLEEFTHAFDECRAKHVMLVMDCCYGGLVADIAGGHEFASAADPKEAYAAAFLTRRARIVLTSGLPDERVEDGKPGEHSPFARAFALALAPADGAPVTGFDVFTRVRRTFLEEGVKHLPRIGTPPGGEPGADVVFFPR